MDKHKLTWGEPDPNEGYWLPDCICGAENGYWSTEAEARAAYADHVYAAVGRPLVEAIRDEGFHPTPADGCPICELLAAVDEALREEGPTDTN